MAEYCCNFESWLACEYCRDYFLNKKSLELKGRLMYPRVNVYYCPDARHPIYGGCETCQKAWAEGKDRIIRDLRGGKARSMMDYCWLYTIEQMIKNGDFPRDEALNIYHEELARLNEKYRHEDLNKESRAKAAAQMVPDPNFSLS